MTDAPAIMLRPRNAWEATDLGIRFLHHCRKPVFIPWILYAVLLFTALHLAMPNNMLVPQLIFWWLKPLHDRLLLFPLQKALFNEPVTLAATFAHLRRSLSWALLLNLTLLRLNPSRSFHLPIWQLEGLQGKTRRERTRALSHHSNGYPFWLTLACLVMEVSLYLSPVVLLYLLLPTSLDIDLLALLASDSTMRWLDITDSLSYLLAIILIEPIYVAAGFMLYINQRIRLEAWDIEWRLRQLGKRHGNKQAGTGSPLIPVLLAVTFTLGLIPTASQATERGKPLLTGDQAGEVIGQIMSRDELRQYEVEEEWYLNFEHNKDTGNGQSFGWISKARSLLAQLIRLLFWLAMAILVMVLIVYRKQWMEWSPLQRQPKDHPDAPATIAGLEVSAAALPDDIPAAARAALEAGQPRKALSLLYRGAILTMLQRDKLPLRNHHTESDILRIATRHLTTSRTRYLAQLTGYWQFLAYGHRIPESGDALTLCQQWSEHFSQREADE